jgi:hypothetical protein
MSATAHDLQHDKMDSEPLSHNLSSGPALGLAHVLCSVPTLSLPLLGVSMKTARLYDVRLLFDEAFVLVGNERRCFGKRRPEHLSCLSFRDILYQFACNPGFRLQLITKKFLTP